MAIYKPIYCTPHLETVDAYVVWDYCANSMENPVEFSCKINTSNKNITGYKMQLYKDGKLIFNPSVISPIRELQNYHPALNIYDVDLNSGRNGTYLRIPFIQNKNNAQILSYNCIYTSFKYSVTYTTSSVSHYSSDSCDWFIDYRQVNINDTILIQTYSGSNPAEGTGIFQVVYDEDDIIHHWHLQRINSASNQEVRVISGGVYSNTIWQHVAGGWQQKTTNSALCGYYDHDANNAFHYLPELQNDGSTYSWEIILYAGEYEPHLSLTPQFGFGVQLIEVDLADNINRHVSPTVPLSNTKLYYNRYVDQSIQLVKDLDYDMVVTSGTVLGSTASRIQSCCGSLSNPKISTKIYSKMYVQLVNALGTQIGNRTYIESYDSTYGHIYPIDGDRRGFDDSFFGTTEQVDVDLTKAKYFYCYKYPNNPVDISTADTVAAVTTVPLSFYWGDSYCPLFEKLPEIDTVNLKEDDIVIIKDQSNKTQNGIYRVHANKTFESTYGGSSDNNTYFTINNTNYKIALIATGRYGINEYKESTWVQIDELTASTVFGNTYYEGQIKAQVYQFHKTSSMGSDRAAFDQIFIPVYWDRIGYNNRASYIGKVLYASAGLQNGGKNWMNDVTPDTAQLGHFPIEFFEEPPIELVGQNDVEIDPGRIVEGVGHIISADNDNNQLLLTIADGSVITVAQGHYFIIDEFNTDSSSSIPAGIWQFQSIQSGLVYIRLYGYDGSDSDTHGQWVCYSESGSVPTPDMINQYSGIFYDRSQRKEIDIYAYTSGTNINVDTHISHRGIQEYCRGLVVSNDQTHTCITPFQGIIGGDRLKFVGDPPLIESAITPTGIDYSNKITSLYADTSLSQLQVNDLGAQLLDLFRLPGQVAPSISLKLNFDTGFNICCYVRGQGEPLVITQMYIADSWADSAITIKPQAIYYYWTPLTGYAWITRPIEISNLKAAGLLSTNGTGLIPTADDEYICAVINGELQSVKILNEGVEEDIPDDKKMGVMAILSQLFYHLKDMTLTTSLPISSVDTTLWRIRHTALLNGISATEKYQYNIHSICKTSDANMFSTYDRPRLEWGERATLATMGTFLLTIDSEQLTVPITLETQCYSHSYSCDAKYVQAQNVSWVSYRQILCTVDTWGQTHIVQDSGRQYDGVPHLQFDGLYNGATYYAVLIVEDSVGNQLINGLKIIVNFVEDYHNVGGACYVNAQYDCNLKAIRLERTNQSFQWNIYKREFIDDNYLLTPVAINSTATTVYDYNCKNEHTYEYICYDTPFGIQTAGSKYVVEDTLQNPVVTMNDDYWTIIELVPEIQNNRIIRYVADPKQLWVFKYNVDTGEQTQNINKTEQVNLAQYPRYSHGVRNNLSGSITAYLGSTLNCYGQYEERLEWGKSLTTNDKVFMLQQWRKLVFSKNPKLLRDRKGQGMIVQISSGSNTPNELIYKTPDMITFSWAQIGNPDLSIISFEQNSVQ